MFLNLFMVEDYQSVVESQYPTFDTAEQTENK